MGKLTTHILNTALGIPAANVRIELHARSSDGNSRCIAAATSNKDGRTNAPLLEAAAFVAGEYELVFHIGDYFRAEGLELPTPAFLDIVVLRVGLADASSHYHVPLLVSPWSYSTYRGS